MTQPHLPQEMTERYDRQTEGVLVTDENGIIVYANSAATRLFHDCRDDLFGRRIASLECCRRQPEFVWQTLEKVKEHRVWQAREIWLDAEGRRRADVRVEKHPLARRQAEGYLWSFRENLLPPISSAASDLSESLEMYRNLVELGSDGVCIVQDEILQFVNMQLAAMIGVEPSDMIGKPFVDYIYDPDFLWLKDLHDRHQAGARELGIVPIKLQRKDGSQIDVEIDAGIIPFRNRPATLVTLHNVSDVVRAKAALEESERTLRFITENSMDIIWSYNLKTDRFDYISPAVEKILGYTSAEACTMNPEVYLDPASRKLLFATFGQLVKEWPRRKNASLELEYKRKDGMKRWLEIHGSLVAQFGRRPTTITGVSRDITERRHDQMLLQESEIRYRSLVDLSPDIIILALKDQILYINETGARLLGADSSTQIIGTAHSSFWLQKMESSYTANTNTLFDNRKPLPFEEMLARRLDGSIIQLEVGGVPFDYQGQPAALIVCRDLTERRETTEKLRYRLKILRLINDIAARFISLKPEQIDQGVEWAMQVIGRFLQAERSATILFEWNTDAVTGEFVWESPELPAHPPLPPMKRLKDFFPWCSEHMLRRQSLIINDLKQIPPDAVQDRASFEQVGTRTILSVPLVYHDITIGAFDVESMTQPRTWGEEDLSLMENVAQIFVHALERKRTDQALRESEETARMIINTTTSLSCLTDRHYHILALNRAGLEFVGKTEAEVLGRRAIDFVPSAWRRIVAEISRRLAQENSVIEETYCVGERWYQLRAHPVADSTNHIARYAFFGRDVTPDREREAQLRLALQSARQAELIKGRFLANMSHEIRTPLNHIIGLASVMLLQSKMRVEERNGYLQMIKKSGESMLHLLTAILELSRIESGKLQITREPFDFYEWIDSLIDRHQLQARTHNLSLRLQIPDDLPHHVVGDSLKLEQILNNLLDNAIKFTPHGSVALSIAVLERTPERLLLSYTVADTGIGIPESERERIFDSFYQVDGSATRKFQGAGLGLTISRELVRSLGGELTVAGNQEGGSRFAFTAPLLLDESVT